MAAHDIYCKIAQAKTWLLLVVKNIAWITKTFIAIYFNTGIIYTLAISFNCTLIIS
jgi:hypothetical protein